MHVIDQVNPDGSFDEHKCQVGFSTRDEAVRAYDNSFSDGKGPARRAAVTSMPFPDFKQWLASGDTGKPLTCNSRIPA